MEKLLLLFLTLFLVFGCTEKKKNDKPIYSRSDFARRSKTMIGICEKLYKERDSKKLHKIAVYTQYARIANCKDVIDECNVYNKTLTLMIKSTEDHIFDREEKKDVAESIAKLKRQIEKAKAKLEPQWH